MYHYSGEVDLNILHTPPVCSMFNEIAKYLEFLMFFPDAVNVIMMTLAL